MLKIELKYHRVLLFKLFVLINKTDVMASIFLWLKDMTKDTIWFDFKEKENYV